MVKYGMLVLAKEICSHFLDHTAHQTSSYILIASTYSESNMGKLCQFDLFIFIIKFDNFNSK